MEGQKVPDEDEFYKEVSGEETGEAWYEKVRRDEITQLQDRLKYWENALPGKVDPKEREQVISEIKKRLRLIDKTPPEKYPQIILTDPRNPVKTGIESAALFFFPNKEEREEVLSDIRAETKQTQNQKDREEARRLARECLTGSPMALKDLVNLVHQQPDLRCYDKRTIQKWIRDLHPAFSKGKPGRKPKK